MSAIEVGRICVKIKGRESGRKCVILDVVGKNFVLLTGPKELTGVRRRRSNVSHIEPLDAKVKIKKGASDKKVISVLKKAGIIQEMKRPLRPKMV